MSRWKGLLGVEPEWLSIARGRVPGTRVATAIGRAPDLSSGDLPADVWTGGPGVYPFPATAQGVGGRVDVGG